MNATDYENLYNDIKKYSGVPLKEGAINVNNYSNCSKWLMEMIEIVKKINKEKDEEKRYELQIELANHKLKLFYSLSIENEANNIKVYDYPQDYP